MMVPLPITVLDSMGASCSKEGQGAAALAQSRSKPGGEAVVAAAENESSTSSSMRQSSVAADGDDDADGIITPWARLDELGDETLLHILSFVSYAPFEPAPEAAGEPPRKRNKNDAIQHRKLIQEYNERGDKLHQSPKEGARKTKNRNSLPNLLFGIGGSSSSNNNNDNRKGASSSYYAVEPERFGTLTHVVPLVSKRWHTISLGTELWSEALERNLRKDAGWATGFETVFRELEEKSRREGNLASAAASGMKTVEGRILQALTMMKTSRNNALSESSTTTESSFHPRELYQSVHDKRPIRLPIFRMVANNVTFGEPIGLFFFEPRYRLLIREVMANRSDQECNGVPIAAPRPRFLYASFGFATHAAILVEVVRCRFRGDGCAEVTLLPVENRPLVTMLDVRERPDTGGLHEATLCNAPNLTTLPIFAMGGRVGLHLVLQTEIQLRFVEERYKRLVAQIMNGRSDAERQGAVMNAPFPQFLFVPRNWIAEARVIDVTQCTIHPDGSADVVGRPTTWVAIWSRKNITPSRSPGLYEATAILPTTTTN